MEVHADHSILQACLYHLDASGSNNLPVPKGMENYLLECLKRATCKLVEIMKMSLLPTIKHITVSSLE